MKILVIDRTFDKTELIDSEILPRVGDNVDLFYSPPPAVSEVLVYLNPKTKQRLGLGHLDAIITVE